MTGNLNFSVGIFPGRGHVIWRDWYTHGVVNATSGTNTTLPAPLGHINVHVRDGSAILLHAQPAYTVAETRRGPFSLLVSQTTDGMAFGTAYIDDGIGSPPGPNKTLSFIGSKGRLWIDSKGALNIQQKLQDVTILGVSRPSEVEFDGKKINSWIHFEGQEKLVVQMNGDLNGPMSLTWK